MRSVDLLAEDTIITSFLISSLLVTNLPRFRFEFTAADGEIAVDLDEVRKREEPQTYDSDSKIKPN